MSLEDEEHSSPGRKVHCSSPSGSVEGRIVVEEEGGTLTDMTVLTWQIGLGETLCYRYLDKYKKIENVMTVDFILQSSLYISIQ